MSEVRMTNEERLEEWVQETEQKTGDVILDDREGLYCSVCRKSGKRVDFLLNNPELPRVVCFECLFTYLTRKDEEAQR